jgi:AcrR family transcriptional regulator
MPYSPQLPRRKDAQRNRLAIVRAAIEVMAGPHSFVEMPEIARRAGVGQATLYRHFPDRYALAAGVVAYQMEELAALARACTASPAAFRDLVRELLRTQVAMRSLVLLLRRADASMRNRYQHQMIATLSEPFRRAQQSGRVRHGLVPDDLVLLCTMVEGVLDSTEDTRAAQLAATRSIDLVIDGMFCDGMFGDGGPDPPLELGQARADGTAPRHLHRSPSSSRLFQS